MTKAGALLELLVTGLALVACGAEDIELAHGDSGATGGDAAEAQVEGAGDDGQAGEAGALDVNLPPSDAGVPVCDAASPAPACRALGLTCGSASDCCSAHCASSVCSPPGACAGAGTPCASRADCCSGLCEPVNGTATSSCLAPCRPPGAACQQASDCCSFACNSGTCGGAECLREGTDCTSNAQCCSNKCDATQGNKCVLDAVASCRPTGEDCTSGGGGPCCGVCDSSGQRCDPGPGPCRALGTVCSVAADCCHGTCTADATGRRVCTSPPLADGIACLAGFECMTGSCIGNPPVCGSPAAACGITGASCSAGTQCCSGACTGGLCQSGCSPAAR